MEIILSAILTSVGIVMLCFGGHWLVTGGVNIAKRVGLSHLVIGITVVAIGTSTPELATSIAASEHSEIVLGNVIGSNIANIGMVIGISAVLAPLLVKRSTLKKEIPIMLGFSLLLIGLSLDGQVSQYDGILLVGCMILFTIWIYREAKKGKLEEEFVIDSKINNLKSAGLVGIGVAFLSVGAILTVDNAVFLAQSFGLSERLIGITVIAIGTSLPELVTSVIAIRKGHLDIGIGNIIGSNIYNILMILGVTATISGIVIVPDVFVDYAIMIAFSLILLTGLKFGKIKQLIGIGLVLAYVVYLYFSFLLT